VCKFDAFWLVGRYLEYEVKFLSHARYTRRGKVYPDIEPKVGMGVAD
jgi:hypothetical protein